MSSSWYVVKFVPDLLINEPVNVGVVVTRGSQYAARFLGEQPDGAIDGRRVRRDIPTQTYREWVAFIRRAAERGDLDRRIERLSARVGDQFVIERRGAMFPIAIESLDTAASDLFSKVVTVASRATRSRSLDEARNEVIGRLDADLERDVVLTVRDKGAEHHPRFDYRYAGESVVLLHTVQLPAPQRARDTIDGFLFRTDLARKAHIKDFVALLWPPADPGDLDDDVLDREIRRIEHYANVVSLDDNHAPDQLAEILGVGLMPATAAAHAIAH